MSTDGFAQVMDRFTNDPTFRDELRSDPEGTIQRAGFSLTDEERHALQGVDWNLSDEQLHERISKMQPF
jgi:hypothetical protein